MTKEQLKEEAIEEFDKEFVKDNGENIEDSMKDPYGAVGPLRNFINSQIDKAYEEGEKTVRNIIKKYY